MLDLLLIPVALLYLLVVGLLFLYGVNFFYLTYLAWRDRETVIPSPPVADWPRVTVQLPVYNEVYVVERLIDAAARLDYPRDRLEIQVLDDSTDHTAQVAAQRVRAWAAQGLDIQHVRRSRRVGYKAGALADGLEAASGEYLAIFDADFIPPEDYLKRTIPHFQDPEIAFVQTRWGHVNADDSILTALQSVSIDAHFIVEQYARFRGGYFFNFNGTAGVWRRAAIQDAGGWQATTLTEDLDLSYRAFLNGWRAVFLRNVEVPAELPVTFPAFRRQQHRWARGSLECALQLLPRVWGAPLGFARKLESTLHLTGYGVHILLFALSLLYPFILVLSQRYPNLISLFGIAVLFNATAFAPTIFFTIAQRELSRRWWLRLPLIGLLSVFGVGMMINTIRAALQIAQGRTATFERTPKFGFLPANRIRGRPRYRIGFDSIVFFELLFCGLNVGTILYAWRVGNWTIAVYAGLFAAGLLFTSLTTIVQSIRSSRGQSEAPDVALAGD